MGELGEAGTAAAASAGAPLFCALCSYVSGPFLGLVGYGWGLPPAKICLKSGVSGQIFFAGLRPAPRWGSRPRPPLPLAPPSGPDRSSLDPRA